METRGAADSRVSLLLVSLFPLSSLTHTHTHSSPRYLSLPEPSSSLGSGSSGVLALAGAY